MNVLLSFPKSASDWLRYIVEYVFWRVTADEDFQGVEKLNYMSHVVGVAETLPMNKLVNSVRSKYTVKVYSALAN